MGAPPSGCIYSKAGAALYRYTTNQLSTYKPRCFSAITSRDPLSFKRDDLADRLFIVDLERRQEFIAESELNLHIPAQCEHSFRFNVNTYSGRT
jgi:hypothetical protein